MCKSKVGFCYIKDKIKSHEKPRQTFGICGTQELNLKAKRTRENKTKIKKKSVNIMGNLSPTTDCAHLVTNNYLHCLDEAICVYVIYYMLYV